MDYEKFMDYVESRTHEDKKAGYANMLHELFVMMRAELFDKSLLIPVSDVLHEMPPFLANDLKGFSDEVFWNRTNKYHDGVLRLLANWFEMGVVMNGFQNDFKELMD